MTIRLEIKDSQNYNMLCFRYWYWIFKDLFSKPVPDGPLPDFDKFRVNGIGRIYYK